MFYFDKFGGRGDEAGDGIGLWWKPNDLWQKLNDLWWKLIDFSRSLRRLHSDVVYITRHKQWIQYPTICNLLWDIESTAWSKWLTTAESFVILTVNPGTSTNGCIRLSYVSIFSMTFLNLIFVLNISLPIHWSLY